MYHRIDGKLVACGVMDIMNQTLNSAYFIYDPDLAYLNLGIVGAIIEMEYMRLIKEKYNNQMRYYHLGELVLPCSKVNYKLNY